MGGLIKIRDLSSRYDISSRTLRYYEDMGLITSTRSEDYAYRLYDETAIKRLEQILILRKLNISIKDIQRIFDTFGSEVVLDVLGRKVSDIDGEVSLLHELKEIILEFIHQIKQADFSKDSDVKLLYEKASKIENTITHVSYEGNPAKGNVGRLVGVTDKMKKMPEVRIVRINPFRVVTSGADTFDNIMGPFQQWQEAHQPLIKKMMYGAPDFLWFEEDMSGVWIWAVEDWVTEADTAPYEIMEFEGGLYAAAMSVDGDDDIAGRVMTGIYKWLEDSNFEPDERPGHRTMCHMLNPADEIREALGYDQLDIYVPIKVRKKQS